MCCVRGVWRHVGKTYLEGKTGWKKTPEMDLHASFHIYLSGRLMQPVGMHLWSCHFLTESHESLRKEKEWLKSANWNKTFAYNRDMASAWAKHPCKTERQPCTLLQASLDFWNAVFPPAVSKELFTMYWRPGLIFHIAFPTSLIYWLQNSLRKLVEVFYLPVQSYSKLQWSRVVVTANATLQYRWRGALSCRYQLDLLILLALQDTTTSALS